ncbi:mitochondrial fission factor homolog A [Tachysurus vachellii]|uniref:mitochondrial fission factor homolog A n=1 Tax=Tachysurus vachellii TaxID=175792 RepID=UPI00296ACC48|nr:mitochondrial fission factor homolog A [Tachysurus vachellii]
MSEADFAVTGDMAEISRVHYEMEYAEDISLQMRIPDRLKVGPDSSMDKLLLDQFSEESHSTMMQVPDRIVVAGDEADLHFRPRELDLIQTIPVESVELKAPPRVLTLQDQPLDFLEPEQLPEPSQLKEEIHSRTRSRRERYTNETRQNVQIAKYYTVSPSPSAPVRVRPPLVSPEDWPGVGTVGGVLSYIQLTTRRAYDLVLAMLDDSHRRTTLVTLDANLEGTPDDLALADAPALRRQIVKLNRRLQVLEHEQKERVRREMVVYSLTAAFWLVNAWMWVRR